MSKPRAGSLAQGIEVRGPFQIPDHVFVIAEIGINHNGDLDLAKQLIDVAKRADCDAVKFQKRSIDKVYPKEVLDSPRQSPWGTTTRQQKEGLEFDKKEFDEIDRYCREIGIQWSASAWDIDSQKFLRQYRLKFNKFASPMLTHWPLVEEVATEGLHTYISTGMSELDEIERAVKIFRKRSCPFTLMHCVSVYPARDEDLGILCIQTLRERFQCPIGYSGHEVGVFGPLAAVMLGATAVERHITMDRTMYGSDQSASMEPKGLQLMMRDIRSIRKALGDGTKRILPTELSNAKKLRHFWKPPND